MGLHLNEGGDDLAENHEINVTPFIDVMLVLLIIFMVAAPLATVDIKVDLPASTAKPAPRPEKPVFLSVKADQRLFLGGSGVDVAHRGFDGGEVGLGFGEVVFGLAESVELADHRLDFRTFARQLAEVRRGINLGKKRCRHQSAISGCAGRFPAQFLEDGWRAYLGARLVAALGSASH